MKTTVIHHSADMDGIFCREIARKFLPDAELIGWDFPDKALAIPPEGQIYILDLPIDRVFGFDFKNMRIAADTKLPDVIAISQPDSKIRKFFYAVERTIWIDHHGSSIATHPKDIPGYRIDGVAACRLAWQWFLRDASGNPPGWALPHKEMFIDRNVSEPLAVRLAGEYDIWDHRGDGDLEFQFGLDTRQELRWNLLLSDHGEGDDYVLRLVDDGGKAMQCYAKRDADIMRARSFMVKWEGLTFLALNTARCNSNTFNALDVPETGHDALMAFYYNGRDWNFSLYHARHRMELDLSLIASKHGGGGHKGACGFKCSTLPFNQKG